MQVSKIQCVINNCLKDEDEVVKGMAVKMNAKFLKYWEEYSVVLALGAVLDPRVKLETLAHCYNVVEADSSTCEAKLNHVKSKLYMLFSNYSSNDIASKSSQTPTSTSKVSQGSDSSMAYLFNVS
jgi:hypothetical protein